jgi:hypothetical protein
MPIRLNLLAEAQAAEELRRRDPVKRALITGGVIAVLMVIASLVFQLQVMRTNSASEDYGRKINTITNEYAAVMANAERLRQFTLHRRGLDILASERFLNGNLLNALQKTHTENVRLVHLRTEHQYEVTEESRAKTNITKVLKPATSTERIRLVVEAVDASPNPGDQVNKFKEALASTDYFRSILGTNNEMRLVNLSPPQQRQDTGETVVQFSLESRLPEKVRLDITSPTRYATIAPQTKKAAAPKSSQTKVKL